jgi:metal-sulfur cluster biosynthetic enzyme
MVTREAVVDVLKKIEDPELFLDIWFLGLIYNIDIKDDESGQSTVDVEMTFTSPMCPAGPQLLEQVRQGVLAIPGVKEVNVRVTFVPPWEPSDDVKGMLGML